MKEPETGELTHRLVVRRRVDKAQRDGPGLEAEFSHVAKRWAKIEPLGTATYQGTVQTGNTITHRIYFRFLPNLDGGHELVEAGRVFRVKRPTSMRGRNIWSVVEVEELQRKDAQAAGEGDGQFGFS
ncbi:head-tail adaptor protein [Pseudomonas proteolytica]|uniref:head-tail adaptor protein n=1 Tax=Pseudomonas proteolytica TaxID=219574 RepID=UPI001473ADCC|nr:head-tail adaptor protein [Pseudomonas proteolytica]NMZ37057.1 head-tail adaptor protein [Pseudomonas proteolytica]